MKPSSPRLISRFLQAFLPIAALVVGTLLIASLLGLREYEQRVSSSELRTVQAERNIFEDDLGDRIRDVLYLASTVADHLHRGDDIAVLRRAMLLFAQSASGYDQVRFLSTDGRELVRINQLGRDHVVVPDEQLQDKSGREYFLGGMRAGDAVYLSRFDLNMEDGKIEIPYKPMLRFSKQVFARDGHSLGLVVLNFYGSRLLERLREASQLLRGHLQLLDERGFWLVGSTPEDEWGFMFQDGMDTRISVWIPDEWQRIASMGSGQFRTRNGLFSFARVTPTSGDVEHPVLAEGGYWTILTHLPEKDLHPSWWRAAQILAATLFVILGAMSWLWIRSRVRQEAAEMELSISAEMLRTISESASDALVMIDSSDRAVFWNPAAERLFGYSAEEMRHNNVHEVLVPVEQRVQAREGMDRFGSGRAELPMHQELDALRRDGTVFPIDLSVSRCLLHGREHAVAAIRDATDRRTVQAALARLTTEDELTGAHNRRHFLDVGRSELLRAQRYGGEVTMIMFDLDHFKSVNDLHGYEGGDAALRGVCDVTRALLRPSDVFGRLGGEEFGLLLPSTNVAGGRALAERLRSAIEMTPLHWGGAEIRVTASFGVVSVDPTTNLLLQLSKAEEALHAAKEGGRNRIVHF